MEYAIIFLAVVGYVIYAANKKAKADQAARDVVFEATMRSLEEKAKREGTFVISYFDKSVK